MAGYLCVARLSAQVSFATKVSLERLLALADKSIVPSSSSNYQTEIKSLAHEEARYAT